MLIRGYMNLNNGKMVESRKVPGKGWRVHEYHPFLEMIDAEPKVSEAGRARVLRRKCREVHAWIEGTLVPWSGIDPDSHEHHLQWQRVSYNPYKSGTFNDEAQRPVHHMKRVILAHGACWIER